MWSIPQCRCLLSVFCFFFLTTLQCANIFMDDFFGGGLIVYNHNLSLFPTDFLCTELSRSRPLMELFTMSRSIISMQHWCSFQPQGSNELWLINPYRYIRKYIQYILVCIQMLCPTVRLMERLSFKGISERWFGFMHVSLTTWWHLDHNWRLSTHRFYTKWGGHLHSSPAGDSRGRNQPWEKPEERRVFFFLWLVTAHKNVMHSLMAC